MVFIFSMAFLVCSLQNYVIITMRRFAMKNFYTFILLTKTKISSSLDGIVCPDQVTYLDNHQIEYLGQLIHFDYLLFDDVDAFINYDTIPFLKENDIPVVNFFKQTSISNMFYTNDLIHTIQDIQSEEVLF